MAHILIIDDSPTEQAGMSQMLHKHGHICSFANTGEIGVAASKKVKPDLILMDVVMPETNGFQATRKITKDPETSHIPIIMVSTKSQATDRMWGMRQGASEYLTKPVNEEILLATVNRLLKK
jgi:twitching motility two-component system response regulator PilH